MVFHKPFIKKSLIFAAENRGTIALVAKLVDAPDLGSGVAIRVGSSPIRRTMRQKRNFRENFPLLSYSPRCCLSTYRNWIADIILQIQ